MVSGIEVNAQGKLSKQMTPTSLVLHTPIKSDVYEGATVQMFISHELFVVLRCNLEEALGDIKNRVRFD